MGLPDKSDYLNKDFSKSLYNLVTEPFQRAMENVPPKYFEMDEETLAEEVNPNPTLNSLRLRVWDEYNKTIDGGGQMSVSTICSGICTPHYLYKAVFRNPLLVAWILCPPRSYTDAVEEALNVGIRQMRKILEDFPLWDSKGQPNVKVAKLKAEIFKMIEARSKGAPVQRHEVNERGFRVTATAQQVKEIMENMSMEDLEKKRKELIGEEEKYFLPEDEAPTMKEVVSREIDVSDSNPKRRKLKV